MSLYRVYLWGDDPNAKAEELQAGLLAGLQELGVAAENLDFRLAAESPLDDKTPSVCLFLAPAKGRAEIEALEELVRAGVPVLPIVPELKDFSGYVPDVLKPFNGVQLSESEGADAVVCAALEWLGLVRKQRRLFISYKRDDSRDVALQLHDYFCSCGFDVFLDTHGVRPAEDFQAVLMHRLCDTDIVVLLDTTHFLKSRWTRDELARASLLNIAILQLIWPDQASQRLPLSQKLYLELGDFTAARDVLLPNRLSDVGAEVERLRSRAVAVRTAAIIEEFRIQAEAAGATVCLERRDQIRAVLPNGQQIVAVPIIGLPRSDQYHDVHEAVDESAPLEAVVLYQSVGMLERWGRHLRWLDEHLPVKAVPVEGVEAYVYGRVAGALR